MRNLRSMISPSTVVILLIVVVGIAAGWSTVRAMEGRRAALAMADSVEVERAAAQALADERAAALSVLQEEMNVVLADLAEQKQRADSMLAALARETAIEEAEALETGETLSETLRTAREAATGPVGELLDTAQVQLTGHLEADRRTSEGFRLQIRAASQARVVAEQETMIWKRLAEETQTALSAREAECQICRDEVIMLRDIKDPSWFERVMDKAVTVAVTAGGTLLIALVIL